MLTLEHFPKIRARSLHSANLARETGANVETIALPGGGICVNSYMIMLDCSSNDVAEPLRLRFEAKVLRR